MQVATRRRALTLGLLLGDLPALVRAQGFPAGPVNLVVPLAAGDAGDIAARLLADDIAKTLNVSVIITNRPGAGGALGTGSVVQARKDGLTVLYTQNSPLTFRPVIEPQVVSYDTTRDLVALGISSRTPSVLVVRADAPYRRFAELVEQARKEPDRVRIGHAGAGSVGDFCVQLINALTGVQMLSVPFGGAAPAITALRGGHIEGVVLALGALSTQMKAGSLRGIVASSRVQEFPELRTMRELGYPEELFGVWFAFLAPTGIPEDARKALVTAVEHAVRSPTIATRLAPVGILQSYGSPEQQVVETREELRRVGALAKKTGVLR